MPKFGALGKFFGKSVSDAAGFAAGQAAAPLLEPALQDLLNKSWQTSPFVPIDPMALAEGVSTGQVARAWATVEATNSGISEERFGRLVDIADTGPGLGQAYRLWRRGILDESGFRRAVKRMGLEQEWIDDLVKAKGELYTPAQIALGVVRSVIADPGWMVTTLDTGDSNVPKYDPVNVDAVMEAAASGIDSERMRGLVGEIGLPMSAQQAASAYFRSIITLGAYNQAILEGDTRPEWAPFILDQARQIASASDYVNARIRGWIEDDEMYAGTARHGMSQEDTHLLYLIHGRPAAPGQMATAAFRGIDGPDGRPMDREQFLKGIAESDIRPEWGPMLWEARYHYPPLFQLSRLVQAGAIDVPTAVDWSHKAGLAPEVVTALERYWSRGTSGSEREATAADLLTLYDGGKATQAETLAALADLGYPADEAQRKVDLLGARKVASAKTTVIGDLHTGYKKGEVDATSAQNAIEALGLDATTASAIVAAWSKWFEAVANAATP